MKPEEYLTQKRSRIEQALGFYLRVENSPVFEAMSYAVLDGGKRYRPLLLLASGQYFGADEELLLPYACAIEFIHNYSLIHDDLPLMDDDDFRRGRPTCHKKFGPALALLAGNGLLSLAFEILAGALAPAGNHKVKEQVIEEIAAAIGPRGLVAGQWLDISYKPENQELAVLQETALKKTAGLIRVSASSGARLGGASPAEAEAVEKFGTFLGLAFQLRDDLEDFDQDEAGSRPLRPNLALFLGQTASLQYLEELLDKAANLLKEYNIDSETLNCFIYQLSISVKR
jgi:geranylgeranyl diphosphate synthase type II